MYRFSTVQEGWKCFKQIANQDQQLQRLVKQAKLKSFDMNTIKDMDTIVILQPGSVQVVLHRDTHGNDHTFTNRRLYQVIDDVDTTRSVNRLVVLYQDVHVKDNTIAVMQLVTLYQDVHNNDDVPNSLLPQLQVTNRM